MSTRYKLSRREFLQTTSLAVAGTALAACSPTPMLPPPPTPETPVTNAEQAIQQLKEGNERYVRGRSIRPHQAIARRTEVATGQKPFAIIFSCVDSRVPPELIFDRGLGDLFVIRTAGQVLDNAALGSIEFGVEELKIPLIMVLGHEKCGAVKATIEAIEKHAQVPAHISDLVAGIKPAVEKVKDQPGDLLDNAVRANIELMVVKLPASSEILAQSLAQNKIKIVGARYDLDTGQVDITES